MSALRGIWTLAATTVADSLWVFPVLGVFGLATNQGGSTLSWFGVLTILVCGIAVGRWLVATHGSSPHTYMTLGAGGLAAVFLGIAAILQKPSHAWDLGWFYRLSQGDVSGPEVITMVVSLICIAALWHRAIKIADEPTPDERLRNTFRNGTLALSVVLVVEFAASVDLYAADCLVPFFAICLGGLAFMHKPKEAEMARSWAKIAGGTILVIVAAGFLFALLGGQISGGLLRFLGVAWSHFLVAAAWILDLVLGPILELFFAFIEAIKPEGGGRQVPVQRPNLDWERIEVGEAAPFVDAVVAFLRFPLIALFLYLLIRFLMSAHRKWNTTARHLPIDVEHERVEHQGDTLSDLAKVLENLTPDWLRRRRKHSWIIPEDRPGITEIFRLYFNIVDIARARGYEWNAGRTPSERVVELESILPGFPVRELTACFNAACFGNIPADRETIAKLEDAAAALRDAPAD